MSKDNTADRATLQRAAGLVAPALASKAYIPAQTHICFSKGWATAFNDLMAISVRCPAPIERLVPGALLASGLASFGGKDVLVQQDGDDALLMKSGRAKIKLPTLALDAFPFKWPAETDGNLEVDDDMLRAVSRCLISVGNDSSHPAQMGVTLDADDSGRAVCWSTDNSSVSRAQCKTKVKLPGDSPVIMPRAFCEQLVALAKAHAEATPVLTIGEGYLEVQFVEKRSDLVARLFHRLPVDLDPLDYPKMMARHCGDVSTLKKRLTVVPEEFDGAVARALLVLQGEVRKRAKVTIDDGTLRIRATTDLGDSDDSMKIDADDVGPVNMDAHFVARGLKGAALIGITPAVTILTDAETNFVHMVAHVRDAQ